MCVIREGSAQECSALQGQKRALDPLELSSRQSPHARCRCWELNSVPLPEQYEQLIIKPPLQLQPCLLKVQKKKKAVPIKELFPMIQFSVK